MLKTSVIRAKLEWKLDCCSGGIMNRVEPCHTTFYYWCEFSDRTLSFIRQKIQMREKGNTTIEVNEGDRRRGWGYKLGEDRKGRMRGKERGNDRNWELTKRERKDWSGMTRSGCPPRVLVRLPRGPAPRLSFRRRQGLSRWWRGCLL